MLKFKKGGEELAEISVPILSEEATRAFDTTRATAMLAAPVSGTVVSPSKATPNQLKAVLERYEAESEGILNGRDPNRDLYTQGQYSCVFVMGGDGKIRMWDFSGPNNDTLAETVIGGGNWGTVTSRNDSAFALDVTIESNVATIMALQEICANAAAGTLFVFTSWKIRSK